MLEFTLIHFLKLFSYAQNFVGIEPVIQSFVQKILLLTIFRHSRVIVILWGEKRFKYPETDLDLLVEGVWSQSEKNRSRMSIDELIQFDKLSISR